MKLSKKNIILIVALACIILAALFTFFYKINEKGSNDKYIIVKENIYLNDRIYVRESDNLSAITLEQQIGITDENQQVYEIEGLNKDDWICVRDGGIEHIFKNANVPAFQLDESTITIIQLKEELALGGYQIFLTEENDISAIKGYLSKDNLVNIPEKVSVIKKVNMYFKEYPSLYLTMYYLHSDEDGCFMHDPITGEVWKIGPEIMNKL